MAALAKLKGLFIGGCQQIRGRGFEKVAAVPLRVLVIGNLQIDADGVKAISKLSHLKVLALEAPAVRAENVDVLRSKRGMAAIATLSGLRNLTLGGEGLDDEAIASLAPLTALENLFISKSSLTGACFATFAPTKLTNLMITDTPLDDSGAQS